MHHCMYVFFCFPFGTLEAFTDFQSAIPSWRISHKDMLDNSGVPGRIPGTWLGLLPEEMKWENYKHANLVAFSIRLLSGLHMCLKDVCRGCDSVTLMVKVRIGLSVKGNLNEPWSSHSLKLYASFKQQYSGHHIQVTDRSLKHSECKKQIVQWNLGLRK